MRSKILGGVSVAILLGLTACGSDPITATPAPTGGVTPTPTPTPGPVSFNVQPCIDQIAVPGRSVAQLVLPDTISIDLGQPSGFPNGRRFDDPVIDVTLAVLLLDLKTHTPGTLANIPLNPGGNIEKVSTTFPYFAPPDGNPPISSGTATTFNFRTDPETGYARVDRMGMPAVATALIGSSQKIPYNEANPSDDAAGTFVPEIKASLTTLHNALDDDLQRLGLKSCAVPG